MTQNKVVKKYNEISRIRILAFLDTFRFNYRAMKIYQQNNILIFNLSQILFNEI